MRVVFVGAGPRAVMLLERLIARLPEGDDGPALEIVLVDPHPPGAGRIWRRDQSPLLKLNSMARDVTVFTDESCTIDGPIRPGPSLIEWAERVRTGEIADVVIADADIAAELDRLRGEDFPTRRLQSCYLDWFWRTTRDSAPGAVRVHARRGTVAAVQASVNAPSREAGARYTVTLADGAQLDADLVVYAVGHNGREPAGQTLRLIHEAAAAGLSYVPPDFTADADLSALRAGEDVIVRGMGLAAVDAVVLLAEGRGGRFERHPDGDGLDYVPSGREPRLHLGSRRGVPYRSKVGSAIQGAPPVLHVLTGEAIAALLAGDAQIDFTRDVWPLICEELVWGHYRELFTGHPDRVGTSWEAFQDVLRVVAGDVEALREAVAVVVPDPLDRFDVPRLDRPLAGEEFASAQAVQERVCRHIEEDLLLRTTPERSPAQAVFLALLLSFLALADIPTERWNARSRAVTLPVTWHTFFSYVASGPPAHRLEELLALARAGIVRFLGPDVAVHIEPSRGFVASSPHVPGELVAATLLDAWLPGSDASVSDNPVLRELALVHGRELAVADADFAGTLGRIDVDDAGRVHAAGGDVRPGLFAIGSFTSATEAGAFTRPHSDALAFRQTDAVAGALADAIVGCSEHDRVVAVADDAVLSVPQHGAGEHLALDVGAAAGELGR
ncbi:MAG: FAD/NAD(P)-binding protein [Microbacterium sp.]